MVVEERRSIAISLLLGRQPTQESRGTEYRARKKRARSAAYKAVLFAKRTRICQSFLSLSVAGGLADELSKRMRQSWTVSRSSSPNRHYNHDCKGKERKKAKEKHEIYAVRLPTFQLPALSNGKEEVFHPKNRIFYYLNSTRNETQIPLSYLRKKPPPKKENLSKFFAFVPAPSLQRPAPSRKRDCWQRTASSRHEFTSHPCFICTQLQFHARTGLGDETDRGVSA
ncbi:hypothetical protein ACLOJK_020766 [Asimina triloba]